MKKRLFAPIILTTLLLSGCNLLPFGPDSTNTSNPTTTTTSTSEEKVPTVDSVTLNKDALRLKPGSTSILTATVKGTNNPSTTVSWESSDKSLATVSDGKVSISSSATASKTVTITATSTVDSSKKASCVITILDPAALDEYTLLMYVCGSTLEYDDEYSQLVGAATEDIQEMVQTSNQPDDVNIVIQTGGSTHWATTYDISASDTCRFHVRNNQLINDSKTANSNMGLSSTLESFLTWGMQEYPAKKYALVLWNHGGAVHGVCSDENFGGDMLKTSEVANAMKNALATTGDEKFEWIGYDACIMNYADNIAVISDYAKYMVCSQELENGDGWAYDRWFPTLYSNPLVDTPTLLDKICNTFVSQYGSTSSNDQQLSALDLSKASDFVSAFKSYTSSFTTETAYNNISSAFSSTPLTFGEDCYGLADMISFLTKMKSKYSSISTTDLENATKALVLSNVYGKKYSSNKPCGVNVFFAKSLDWQYPLQAFKSDYTTSDTKFDTWRKLNIDYGDWAR